MSTDHTGSNVSGAEIRKLKAEITRLNEVLHRKNVMLDALHMVWCDGGCKGGTHRWTEDTISEEVVEAAERNTARLRQWWANKEFRRARGTDHV